MQASNIDRSNYPIANLQPFEAEVKEKDSKAKPIANQALQQIPAAAAAAKKKKKKKKKSQFLPQVQDVNQVLQIQIKSLTDADLKCILEIISKSHLDGKICLMDILGLEIWSQVQSLKESHDGYSKTIDHYSNEFSLNFAFSYIGLLREEYEEGILKKKLILDEHFFPRALALKQKLDELEKGLSTFEGRLISDLQKKIEHSSNDKIKGVLKQNQAKIKAKFESTYRLLSILVKLLQEKDGPKLLYKTSISFLSREDKANLNPEENLLALIQYATFLNQVFINAGGIAFPFKVRPFDTIIRELSQLRNSDQLVASLVLRKHFKVAYREIHEKRSAFYEYLTLTQEDKLTHKQFCQQMGIKKVQDLTKEKSISQLTSNATAFDLLCQWTEDVQRMFESGFLAIKFPDEFVPSALFYHRVMSNIFRVADKKTALTQQMKQTLIEIEQLPDDKKSKLQAFQKKVDEDFEQLTLQLVQIIGEEKIFQLNVLIADCSLNNKLNVGLALPVFNLFTPIFKEINNWVVESFIKLKKEHIKYLSSLFPNHTIQQLKEKKVIHFCQVICFETLLKVLPHILLLKDVEELIKNDENPSLINGDWHLAPLEVIDYAELSGWEDAFDRVPQQKIQPDVQGQNEAKSFEKFKIERGAKVRKFLKQLYALGYLPKSIKGDHLKLVDEKGKEVIVPLHKHLNKDTANSVEKQVEG